MKTKLYKIYIEYEDNEKITYLYAYDEEDALCLIKILVDNYNIIETDTNEIKYRFEEVKEECANY